MKVKDLRDRYIEQIPMIAAMMVSDEESESMFDDAAQNAVSLIHACLVAVEEDPEGWTE